MLLLLAIFIKLSPRCPDGVGSRLKLVRHVAGHCPLGPTLLIRLLTLLLLPLLLNNLWQTVWGTPPLSTFSLLSYIAGVFKSSIIPYQLLLVATGNPDYQSEMIRDKFDLFVTVATTRQRAECCLDMCFHRKDLLASGSVEWCLHGSKRRDLKCPQEKCGGDAGWTPPDVQIRPILLLQSALFLSPVKVAAVFDEVQFHKSVQFNLEILAEKKTHLLVFWRVISNLKNAPLEHSNRSFQNG